MHPLIRILCLLALAAALPVLALPVLALLLGVLLLGLACMSGALRRWAAGLWRLKWLFLALLVLYLGQTPGTPLWDRVPGISIEGLTEGLRRAAVLAALLAAVQALLATTQTPELVAALRQLLRPLAIVGVDGRRFATRLGLVLAAVAQMQTQLAQLRGRGTAALDAAAALVTHIERHDTDDTAAALPQLALPHPAAFLLPLVLGASLLWLGR